MTQPRWGREDGTCYTTALFTALLFRVTPNCLSSVVILSNSA